MMFSDGMLIDKYKLDELDIVLELVEEAIENAINHQQISIDSDESIFLIYTSGKCLVTTREIMVLCSNGFPDGALALSRNLYEQMIITAYIKQINDKEERIKTIKKYIEDYDVQRFKNVQFAYHINSKIKDAQYANEKKKEILNKYGIDKYSDYWWAPGINSFAAMCQSVENNKRNADIKPLLINSHLLYKRACLAMHASSIGNRIRLGSNIADVDLGPWNDGQEYALYLATVSLIQVFGYTSQFLNFKFEDAKRINLSLNRLAIYYDSVSKINQKNTNKVLHKTGHT